MQDHVSDQDGKKLLQLARESILKEFSGMAEPCDQLRGQVSKAVLKKNRGIFVSLHKKGKLRGCIGNIEPVKTIFDGIVDNARHAAFKDSRFQPMLKDELSDTQIEISILTKPEPIEYTSEEELISQLRPGVDGVILEQGYHKATFLPQVWEQLQTPEDFLGHLCMKAGLSATEWRLGQLACYRYQVQLFSEDE